MSYRKVNETFRRRMVCRIGVDCGLFVEINYMVDAMIYCLAHHVRFQLYSDDANFGTGVGWTEYFLPFCEEVHEPFHRWCNFHRLPSWYRILKGCRRQKSIGPIVWKIKSMMKTMAGRLVGLLVYKEYILFDQDVVLKTNKHILIPKLGMNCNYIEIYGLLTRMIWRLQPDILQQQVQIKEKIAIPYLYDSIQIRGGDKMMETTLISGKHIIQALNPKAGSCVFILTDDYRQYQELLADYPNVRFLTLCQPEERGYLHKAFSQKSQKSRQAAITRLIISVDLLLSSRSFVGSITTGPSVFVMKLRAGDPHVQAVDCPRENMISSLSKTIEVRAAISKKICKSKIFYGYTYP